MEFRHLFISFILIGLVAFSAIMFIITLQADNGNSTILNNAQINNTYTRLQNALRGSQDTTTDAKTGFESEQPSTGFGSLIFYTIVSSGKIFTGTITLMFGVLTGGIASAFGISSGVGSIILIAFTTIIIASIVLMLWSLYRLGR